MCIRDSSLIAETFSKCLYCEEKIPSSQHGDVEHLAPKRDFPFLRLVYWNLSLACIKCNGKKSSNFDAEIPWLNPFEDNPAEHIMACGPMLISKNDSVRGRHTIGSLHLNRPELVEKRIRKLDRLDALCHSIRAATNSTIKRVLRTELDRECESDNEFALVAREFVSWQNLGV